MEDEKEKINDITLEKNEIKVKDEEVYDQDIGQEYRIELEEVNYEEATDINEIGKVEELEKEEPDVKDETFEKVVDNYIDNVDNDKVFNELDKLYEGKEEPKEEVKKDLAEEEEIEKIIFPDSPVEKVEEKKKVPSEEKTENPIEQKQEKVKAETDDTTLKSDKKIIKIVGILALLFVIATAVLMSTRKKEEKAYPVIELVGDETIILEVDSEYKESGYFALDLEDGDITDHVTVIGEVDTLNPGVYKIKYKVLDTDRMKTEVYRNVIVKSKINNFEFSLKGDETVFVNQNSDYVESGYDAKYHNQDVNSDVEVFGEVDCTRTGNYNLYYVLSKDNQVVVLRRTVIVYKGEEMSTDAELVTDLNNWLIDEIHYSNRINLENVSPAVLLYFGALNCQNDKTEITNKNMNSCLESKLNIKDVDVPISAKYQSSYADITYSTAKNAWVVNKLELPRFKDNLSKVIVDNDTIYIYELYGYEVLLNNREICDGNDNKIVYSGVDRTKLLGYESCQVIPCDNGVCEENVIRNKNYNLALYVHTFKLNNGKYYWVSSEMIK